MTHWTERVPRRACKKAIVSALNYSTFADWWADCKRPDWMLWGVGKMAGGEVDSLERKRLVACVLECALTVREHMPPEALSCCEAVKRYLDGDATLDDVRPAACAADAAAYAAAYAMAFAAYAAAYAAYAASYAVYAAYAANAIADATMADIVRRHYPDPPELP